MTQTIPRILVVSPKSNRAVTNGMAEALDGILGHAAHFDTIDLSEAPLGIETEIDAVNVAPMLVQRPRKFGAQYDAYVIGYFLDPGLNACRQVIGASVFGVGECAVCAALSASDQSGVLALSGASVARHKPIFQRLGVWDRLAGELPLNISVAEAVGDAQVFPRILQEAEERRDDYGAGAIVLGCAAMERRWGLP